MAKKNTKRGFTLVELIVILVILAILAALLIPALTGYIDKARKSQVVAETRMLTQAVQTEMSTLYGSNEYAEQVSKNKNTFTVAAKDGAAVPTTNTNQQTLPSRCYVTFCRGAQGWNCEVVQGVGKMEKKSTPNGLTVQAL